jgi:3-hydroxy-9,10-secoandrosta-1,3,5(10)-triene-9,17-dione monooxygenase reductase component
VSTVDSRAATVDAKDFRAVLGHFPTGVVVITALCPDGMPAGMAIGSFTSVSLDPPLIAFLPAKNSSSWPRMREAGSFCVNVLGHGQAGLVERFALSGGDKFAGLDWTPAPSGHPILPGVPAWIDCELVRVDDAGDHWIVLGLVASLSADSSHPGSLVFCRGTFGQFVAVSRNESEGLGSEPDGSRSWWW